MYKYLILFFALWLTSCATPQYQTRYQLTPPSTAEGKVCLARCEASKQQCNNQCNAQSKQCSIKASQQAKRDLPGLQVAWERDIAVWEQAMARYERDLWFWEIDLRHRRMMRDLVRPDCRRGKRGERGCEGLRHLPDWGMSGLYRERPESPDPAPKRPTLASETARISSSCPSDCGCETVYRQCYSSCGGLVQSIQIPQ